jgi:5'-nucleotidase
MKILVVNDDSIFAPGLKLLVEQFLPYGEVFVVAPHSEQSAIGHGITIHEPMKLHRHDDFMEGVEAWSLEGKPADCVKFALYGLNLIIDLVVSGINNGMNLGTDVIYSGTMAGATEAIICGVPAIAFSTDVDNFDIVKREMPQLVKTLMDAQIVSTEYVLNVNFPSKEYSQSKGIQVTIQGERPFNNEFILDGEHYWAKGTWRKVTNGEDTDVFAFESGYTSISPIGIDRTNYNYLQHLNEKLKNL